MSSWYQHIPTWRMKRSELSQHISTKLRSWSSLVWMNCALAFWTACHTRRTDWKMEWQTFKRCHKSASIQPEWWQLKMTNFHLGHSEFLGFSLISNHFDSRTCKHSTQRTDSACFWVSGRVQSLFITKLRWALKPGMGGASKGQTELPLPWSWWWELPGAHDTTRTLCLVKLQIHGLW